MINDHYGVRKKARKCGKCGTKQNSAAWKFRTQKSDGNIYFEFEDKFGAFLRVHFIHTHIFQSLGGQESNTSNNVQIKAKMKKLWPFEDNCTKLKGHFKMISKFNL